MDYLTLLDQTVTATLAASPIGTPLFVRWTAALAPTPAVLNAYLAALTHYTTRWLSHGSDGIKPLHRLYATGTAEQGHLSLTLEYATGASALLALTLAHDRPHMSLAIFGNQGALYQSAYIVPIRDGELGPQTATGKDVGHLQLMAAIEASLAARQPVQLAPTGASHSFGIAKKGPDKTSGAIPNMWCAPRPKGGATMNEPPFGVLLVSGKLTHQENYAPMLRADPRCTLVGLSDETTVSPTRARLNAEYAAELGIPYWPDLAEALARADVHLVSVCAEPERRAQVVAQCAAAGKHLYIDKPLTPSLQAADAAVAAVQSAGVRSQMFSFNHQPWAQRARQVIDSGAIGDLVAIHADNLFAKGPGGTATLGTPRQAAYPPTIANFVDAKAELYAMGIYALGLVCWLAGRAVERVYGSTANYFFAAHQAHNVEDFGLLSLRLAGGVTATITGGRVGWASHPSAGTNQLYLIGTAGSLLIDAYGPRLERYAAEPPWTPPAVNQRDPMGFWRSTQAEVNTRPNRVYAPLPDRLPARSDVSHFIDCIVEGRESAMNIAQAAYLTEILLAGYQSAALGQVVELPLSRSATA